MVKLQKQGYSLGATLTQEQESNFSMVPVRNKLNATSGGWSSGGKLVTSDLEVHNGR